MKHSAPGAPPLVTVLIPAHNAAGTIRRALDSALAQDYPHLEIIVIDDGSIDATSDVVASYRREDIRLLRLPHTLGEFAALNRGIPTAAGEYVAFLGADDEWLPQKLSRQIPSLENNPKATLATCGCRVVDRSGAVIAEFSLPPRGFRKDQIWRCLLAEACISQPCVVVRASAFATVGLFDPELPVAGDQDLWIRLAVTGEVESVDEFLTICHDTAGSPARLSCKDEDRYGLPMVRRHIAAQRKHLLEGEIRDILARRYRTLGRKAYRAGRVWRGGQLLCKAIALGDNKRKNLWYLVTASPLAELARMSLRPGAGAELMSPARPSPGNALLAPSTEKRVELPAGPPILVLGVDLEAEFDWSGPRLRTDHSVGNVRQQALAHKVFDKFGVRPIYLVDYAAATQADGYGPLREWAASQRCEIGAHLQAWENPPFAEELGECTSYSHNLPAWLQKEKLSRLTEAITTNIGVEPVIYRAGRYGIGEEMAWILPSFGYRIDMSVLPGVDLRPQHGPDFRRAFNRPYWFGRERDLLEIPLTVGFCGLLSQALPSACAVTLYDRFSRPGLMHLHGPGLFARLGLLERIRLTPEGISLQETKRLTRHLLARGHRVFSFNYHSSSLLPGYTPYVRDAGDLDRFLGRIAGYLEFFFGELGGMAMTPGELHAMILAPTHALGNRTQAASLAT